MTGTQAIETLNDTLQSDVPGLSAQVETEKHTLDIQMITEHKMNFLSANIILFYLNLSPEFLHRQTQLLIPQLTSMIFFNGTHRSLHTKSTQALCLDQIG